MTAPTEAINPTELFTGPGRYSLKITNNSMINSGIMSGDYVILEHPKPDELPPNGAIVVAVVNDQPAQLRRIFFTDQNVELRCDNTDQTVTRHPPSNVRVVGKMVGLFRSY